jgi:CelD/BcsL family acetyltransferase involved in cellulose biosynthesis
MDAAVNHLPGRESAKLPASVPQVCEINSVEVFSDLALAEPFWRRIEASDALGTPYQRFDFLAAWQQHVGVRNGVTPFIVIGFGHQGEPAFVWPFGHTRNGPLNVIQFLGSKHANFNVGWWRRDVAATVTAQDVSRIFERILSDGNHIDLLALFSQPFDWAGVANPFALLPHQNSVDFSMRLTIDRPADALIELLLSSTMRGRLRGKTRKLQKLPGYRYVRADEPADIDRILDAFFAFKSVRMAQQGLTNVFAAPGVEDFLRTACHSKLPDGRSIIEIHALEADAEVLAIFAVVSDEHRCTSMFNSYTLSENARHSPGLILIHNMVLDCAERGLRGFDLGVGKADYKSIFCNQVEPLFDTIIGLTPLGKMAAPGIRAATAAKGLIKRKPALWGAVQALRRLRAHR